MCDKVLIVDDTRLNINILTDILVKDKLIVSSTDSSVDIVDLVLKENPDVILLDIVMPVVDGFEVCRLLKNNENLRDIPIIMVTADTSSVSIKKALDLGAFDYVKKPFEEIEIVARIHSALKLKEYQDKLKVLALRDDLTGLYNRVAFNDLFDVELSKQERDGSSLSFVMLDVDNFKTINDTYGHLAGDYALKEISRILVSSVRCSDIVGRFGGDEFSIVLTQINLEDSFNVCDRIRKRVEEFEFNFNAVPIKLTVSMGVFSKNSLVKLSRDEIVEKADKELYLAKKLSKNKVRIV